MGFFSNYQVALKGNNTTSSLLERLGAIHHSLLEILTSFPLLPSLDDIWFHHINLLSLLRYMRGKKEKEKKLAHPTGSKRGSKRT